MKKVKYSLRFLLFNHMEAFESKRVNLISNISELAQLGSEASIENIEIQKTSINSESTL